MVWTCAFFLTFQFLLLLTFSLSVYVTDENSQNFHDWYTEWGVPDRNINLIQEKNPTYCECKEKGGRLLWVNCKVFYRVEYKYSFSLEAYIDMEEKKLSIPGHIPWKWNEFTSKELCNLFQNVKALNMKQSCSWQYFFWTIFSAFSFWTAKYIEFSTEKFWASAVFETVVSTC